MNIARASRGDAPRISALIHALSDSFLAPAPGDGAQAFFESISPRAVERYLCDARFDYFVATHDERLAGVIALRDKRHLFHLFVAEAFQGQGLARKLWQTAQSLAMDAGHAGDFTVNASLRARPIYERFGFTPSGPVTQVHGIVYQAMRRANP